MKKSILTLTLACVSALVSLNSCSVEGCTDGDANNFSADADEDDGSCMFDGELVFWYNEKTSDFLVDDEAVTLTYYFDNELVGSSAANVFWTGEPECGQTGAITIQEDLGKSKTKSFSYKVEDQTGHQYYSGSVTMEANTCVAFKLD